MENTLTEELTNKIQEDDFNLLRIKVLEKLKVDRGKATELIVNYIKTKTHIKTIRTDKDEEVWTYKEGIYIPEGKTYIIEHCRRILGESFTSHLCNDVIRKIGGDTFINEEDFFQNKHIELIPVQNGILNIVEKKLMPFDPNIIFFNKINAKYDPFAEPKVILDFFNSVLKNPETDLPVIQEMFGFCLYRDYRWEKAFMLVGEGRNGKGKTIELLKRLIGASNCANLPLSRIQSDKFCLWELFGKMVNIAADMDDKALKDTSTFKSLTGHDLITADRKFKMSVSFVNYAKFICGTNKLPTTDDLTDAFWDRWIILEFPYYFATKEEIEKIGYEEASGRKWKVRDEGIIERITVPEEMSGLLNFALNGLGRLMANNKFSYDKNHSEVKNIWQKRANSFIAYFKDCCVEEYGGMVRKQDLFEDYMKYCRYFRLRPVSEIIIKKVLFEQFGAWEERETINHEKISFWLGFKISKNVSEIMKKNEEELRQKITLSEDVVYSTGQGRQGFSTHESNLKNFYGVKNGLSLSTMSKPLNSESTHMLLSLPDEEYTVEQLKMVVQFTGDSSDWVVTQLAKGSIYQVTKDKYRINRF